MCVLGCFSRFRLFATPWTAVRQAALSLGFSRQEYWSVLPCPPPGGLPGSGIEPMSPSLAGTFFTTEPPRKPRFIKCLNKKTVILYRSDVTKESDFELLGTAHCLKVNIEGKLKGEKD